MGTFPRYTHVKVVQYVQSPWWIAYSTQTSPGRLGFPCMFEVEWILPQLLNSLCWVSPPIWRHDEPGSLSCSRRIHTLWVLASGCAPGNNRTQHASIPHAPPPPLRRPSHYLSTLNCTLSSALLGSSALISEIWLWHCTAQMAYIHIQKILGFPQWKQCTALILHLLLFAKNHLQVQAAEVSCSH